jgi:hypothetical protein
MTSLFRQKTGLPVIQPVQRTISSLSLETWKKTGTLKLMKSLNSMLLRTLGLNGTIVE